jgi:surface carbohydrate biosynthesis protein
MRIGYIVDHPKRDMPSGLMVAAAFARRGIETALIPLYEQGVDVPLLGLDALVINFARPVNLDLVCGYASTGLPIWVLDTEGGVLADDGANSPNRMAEYVRDSGFSTLLSGYFFWGRTLYQAFVDHSGMRKDQLHLTGCPRFDYAATMWRDLLDYRRNGYILVNANFPLVNPRFAHSAEAEIATLVAAGWTENYVQQLLADSRLILANYLDTVRKVAEHFPSRTFLVRPHPFENAELYLRHMQGLPNVIVDGSGSVLNVIHHAECVVHLNCGTAIEAILLGKLPLSMEFLNTGFMARHSSLPSRVSLCLPNEQALIAAIDDLETTHAAFPFKDRHADLIEPWFHVNDGQAADRIADVIFSHIKSSGCKKRRHSLAASLASSRARPRLSQLLQALTCNLLGSRRASALRTCFQPHRRDKRLLITENATAFNALIHHAGRANGFRLEQALHPLTGVELASLLIRR